MRIWTYQSVLHGNVCTKCMVAAVCMIEIILVWEHA